MPTEEQLDISNNIVSLRNGLDVRAAQRLTISDRLVTRLSFSCGGYIGSPTGDVIFTIRKVSDDSIINSKVWGDAGSMVAGWQEVEFDTPVTVNEEVRICFEFYGGGFNNELLVKGTLSDVKADEYHSIYRASSWTDYAGRDLAYKYTYGSAVVSIDGSPMAQLISAGLI